MSKHIKKTSENSGAAAPGAAAPRRPEPLRQPATPGAVGAAQPGSCHRRCTGGETTGKPWENHRKTIGK